MQRVARAIGPVVKILAKESIRLEEARDRFLAGDVLSHGNLPAVDEALRDGFAIRGEGEPCKDGMRFTITGEVAAGDLEDVVVLQGQAVRIFTGARVPEGIDRVVSQERCRVTGIDMVEVPFKEIVAATTCIKPSGSEIAKGQQLVRKGQRLGPHHLALLATAGFSRLDVYRQPNVACYSTGSELVGVGRKAEAGQKISSNSIFLQNRLAQYGGRVVDYGLIEDTSGALRRRLQDAVQAGVDLVVTTGGMGPGKYDLVVDDFIKAGGTIHCSSLPLRPGKSLLVGTIDATMLIALPGPPSAVEVLTDIIAGPVLYGMQGRTNPWPAPILAELITDIRRPHPMGIDQLRPAQISYGSGHPLLRLVSGPEESGNCLLLFPGEKAELNKKEVVHAYIPVFADG